MHSSIKTQKQRHLPVYIYKKHQKTKQNLKLPCGECNDFNVAGKNKAHIDEVNRSAQDREHRGNKQGEQTNYVMNEGESTK